MPMKVLLFLVLLYISLSKIKSASARDTLNPTQPLTDEQTLVSSAQSFELGFFRPGNSPNWYLGIWFKNMSPRTVVWVANRERPITNTSDVLVKLIDGNLVVANKSSNSSIWSSSNHSRVVGNTIAQLLDTGNLVVRDENYNGPSRYLWQSFDYPSDTLLQGAKLGRNLKTGLNRQLTSWTNFDDPSRGNFSYGIDLQGFPDPVLRNGREKKYRSGPWNGVRFSGAPNLINNPGFKPTFVSNDEEVYYMYEHNDVPVLSRLGLSPSGMLNQYTWNNQSKEWVVTVTMQADQCRVYGLCGVNGICNVINAIVCNCLKGFEPKSQQDWDRLNWSSGCRRKTPFDCSNGDKFLKLTSVKFPAASSDSLMNKSMTLKECEVKCLKNCSCTAYANSDIRNGGSGCILWFGDLLDIVGLNTGSQDLYVRLASSELDAKKEKRVKLVVSISIVVGALLFGSIVWCIIWRKRRGKKDFEDAVNDDETRSGELELPLFDFVTIATATSNFSINNKLGQGGFGSVYKGKLVTGQEIAVKRLSANSGQGVKEFKNEVFLIAKLQHWNLVRLLGCCIQRNEKMLIYEYMPNNSLDSFIFDHTRRRLLGWQKRFNIIVGIAQGLLYLHRDSRLRIIHRDLKASNILLDDEMNPKISDFGLARTFGRDQTQANTIRVAGTYGYMSPEYAIDGLFSMKSDVFSFGVLVLEIVSGKKNRGFNCPDDHCLNLLGHAWNLWNEGKAIELVDPVMEEAATELEVLRCIQMGLLCVQQHPKDRLTMASVVSLLSNETVSMPQPKLPGFYYERHLIDESLQSMKVFSDAVESSLTLLEGR